MTHLCERFRRIKSTLLRAAVLLPLRVRCEHMDVFHGLDQSGIPLFFKAGKYVLTIHNVIPLVLPWAFSLRHRWVLATVMARIRRQAEMVIVPSTAATEDVVHYLQVEQERISVIPMGCDALFQASGEPTRAKAMRRRYGLPERSILFVGTLKPRKNVKTLLQAFAQVIAETPRDELPLALQALQRQIPLLVNAGAHELKKLCLASNAGLFYANPEELRECLGLLLSIESLRISMGINGGKFIESYGMSAVRG